MQQKPFPWTGTLLALAAMFAVAWLSISVADIAPPGSEAQARASNAESEDDEVLSKRADP